MQTPNRDRTDDEWITKLRDYEPDVCEELYRICLRVCRHLLSDWAEADEELAASEARGKIITEVQKPTFSIEHRFMTFAHVVANRHCHTIQRAIIRARARLPVEPLPTDEELAARHDNGATAPSNSDPVDPTAIAQRAAMARLLEGCYQQLDEIDQRILRWCFEEERGPTWIAAVLGPPMTANNVGVRRNRAIRKLKKCTGAAA